MSLVIGTAAGATDIRTKSRSPGTAGIRKERVIVLWAGRRHWVIGGFRFRRSGFPDQESYNNPIAQSGLQPGLVHRF
jgi:hypothetical protein